MEKYFTIAFYNLENLFDIFDDKYTRDDDFLPTSEKHWTPKRYKKKVRKLGYTISKIGTKTSSNLPVLIGLAEVENKLVVNDLIHSKFLKTENYDIVHYDSPDERGIDVALIAKHFGGGGHAAAAGADIQGTLDDVQPIVLKTTKEMLGL